MSLSPRQAVIILGMHRSGTSALSGALARLGLSLPRTPVATAADNPEGFYEFAPIVHENFKILTAANCAWNVTFTLEPAALQAAAQPERHEALYKILHAEFGDAGSFVLKDPRLCLLLPLWFPGLRRLTATQPVLLAVRHPAEVVRSHDARGNHPESETLMNWLHHMLEAEHMSRPVPRATLLYDDLVQDWRRTLGQALRTANIAPPRTLQEAAAEIDDFISPALRHHRAAEENARIGPPYLAPLLDSSWRALKILSEHPNDNFALATLDDARYNLHIIRHGMIRQGIDITIPPELHDVP